MGSSFRYKPRKNDPFYAELHREVMNYFKTRGISCKGTIAVHFRTALILAGIAILYYMVVFAGIPAWGKLACAALLGLCMTACAFNIAHEALHNDLSESVTINRLLGYSMDIMGSSSYLWKINHGAHHSFTNVHGLDGDIKDSGLLRLCPLSPHKPLHRLQPVTFILLYACFYLLIVYVFNTMNILGRNFGNGSTKKHPRKKVVEFIAFKLLYLVIWLIIPLYEAPAYIYCYLLMSAVIGISFTTVFFLAHNVMEIQYAQAPSDDTASWAAHQLTTTSNFSTPFAVTLLLGGMNYQAEHHLFPQVCSIHFPRIQPVVQRVAARYNIPYHVQPGFIAALRSHVRLLVKLSKP